jgi:hypothetical protein
MKKTLILLMMLVIGAVQVNAQKAEYFGAKIKKDGAISTADFLKAIDGKDSLNVKLQAPINEACQKKGCWMNVDLGNGQAMMVRFKDYGFFVPKDCNGKTAIMNGVAYKEVVSVDMLRHYAEDAGKSKEEIMKITQPETRLSFEADGVMIFATK